MKFKDITVGGVYFDSDGTKSNRINVTQEALDDPRKAKMDQHILRHAKVIVTDAVGYYRGNDYKGSWEENTPNNKTGKVDGHLNQAVRVHRVSNNQECYVALRDLLGEWDSVIPGLLEATKVRDAQGKIDAQKYRAHREYEKIVREPALLRALGALSVIDPEITRNYLDHLPDKTIEFLGNYPW